MKDHIKLSNLSIFSRVQCISKVTIVMAAKSWKHLYDKNNFCHLVTLAWFTIQILVNSKIFKLSLNLSLTYLRAQLPVMD